MKVSFERRDGRLTVSEYRAVVTAYGAVATGEWCYTKKDAGETVEALRRSLFDAERAGERVATEGVARIVRMRTRLDAERRVGSWGL